jgi:hypothetical protein
VVAIRSALAAVNQSAPVAVFQLDLEEVFQSARVAGNRSALAAVNQSAPVAGNPLCETEHRD